MNKIFAENLEPIVVAFVWALGGAILGYMTEGSMLNITVNAAIIGCVIGFCMKWYRQGRNNKT